MYYVGLDVHHRSTSVEILDCDGKLVKPGEWKLPWPGPDPEVGSYKSVTSEVFNSRCRKAAGRRGKPRDLPFDPRPFGSGYQKQSIGFANTMSHTR